MKQPDNTRKCAHCGQPVPIERNRSAIYCHSNCSRKAVYRRKSPEERAVINARSNRRRFEKDLLPHIRSISKGPELITPGTPLARYVVAMFLIARMGAWKLDLALNYSSVQDALASMAGGYDELEKLEDLIFEKAIELMEAKPIA